MGLVVNCSILFTALPVLSRRLLSDPGPRTVFGDNVDVAVGIAVGRGVPGTGSIEFARVLGHLRERGYRGDVSLAYTDDGPDPIGWPAAVAHSVRWTGSARR